MADLNSTDVAGPIDKGLLEDETIGYSAVAKLAGIRKIGFGERQIWHRIEAARGAVVGEGETKPNTGVTLSEVEVIASKIVRDYSYSMEAMARNPELFEQLVEIQSKGLANDFDQIVLGVLPAVGGNLDTFATGTPEQEIATQEDFWTALGSASKSSVANGLLLTPTMYTALRKQVNQSGNPQHLFEGDMNEGRINGIDYVTVWGVSEAIGILGPWKNRTIATLGDAISLKNPYGNGWRQNETEAFVEIAAGFKVVDKNEFVKLTVGAPVDPNPEPSNIWSGEIEVENLGLDQAEYLEDGTFRIHGSNAEENGTIELSGTIDIDGITTDVSGYSSSYYFNTEIGGAFVADFNLGAATSVENVNVTAVYTAPEPTANFDFNGITMVTHGEGETLEATTTYGGDSGLLEITVGEGFDGMTLTLSGTYDVDGAGTETVSDSAIIDEFGFTNFQLPSLVGEILNWNVTGTIS